MADQGVGEPATRLLRPLRPVDKPGNYTNKATDLIKGLFPRWVSTETNPLRHKVGPGGGCRGKQELELVAFWLGK